MLEFADGPQNGLPSLIDAGRNHSHQSEQQSFENVQQNESDDWTDIEPAEVGDDAPERCQDWFAQLVTPAHPRRVRGDRQPGADYSHDYRRLENPERPAHQQVEDSSSSFLRGEH